MSHHLKIEPLPQNWTNVVFSDVCDKVSDSCEPKLDGYRIYIGLEHIQQGFPTFLDKGIESDVKSSKTSFHKGDLLFGKLRPYLKKAVLSDFDGICSTDILVFRPKENAYKRYLLYLLHSNPFIEYAKSTTTGVQHPRTSWNSLKKFSFSIPTNPEQKKIAHILSTIQKAIEQQEQIIGTTTELKKALMQKLFTEGLRGEPQKDTEIGPVPESWEVVELGQISHKPEYGFTESAKASGNVQFLRITDIQAEGVQWSHVPFCECPDELLGRYLLANNDILFARIGATTGKNFLVKEPPLAVFASYLIRVRLNDSVSADFISQFCDTIAYWHQISANKGNNLKGGINSSTLKKLLVPIPPERAEQEKIAETLQILDKKIRYAREKSRIFSDLFKTLLHHLMTGQIRVNDVEFEGMEAGKG